jgi:DNA-binding response OmpR family regulator
MEPMTGMALICVDDPALTASLVRCLGAKGWDCVTDESLVGTLTLVARYAPDLLLLDARAEPLLRELKGDERTALTTVLMVSAAGCDRRRECLDAGALAVVDRPTGLDVVDDVSTFITQGRLKDLQSTAAARPPLARF